MSKIVGSKRFSASTGPRGDLLVTSEPTDAIGNGGLHTMIFGNPLGSKMVTVGDVTYIGECGKPGADTEDPVWRITRQETLADGVEILHAYVPAAGAVLARYAGFDHVFDDYATLDYAY